MFFCILNQRLAKQINQTQLLYAFNMLFYCPIMWSHAGCISSAPFILQISTIQCGNVICPVGVMRSGMSWNSEVSVWWWRFAGLWKQSVWSCKNKRKTGWGVGGISPTKNKAKRLLDPHSSLHSKHVTLSSS